MTDTCPLCMDPVHEEDSQYNYHKYCWNLLIRTHENAGKSFTCWDWDRHFIIDYDSMGNPVSVIWSCEEDINDDYPDAAAEARRYADSVRADAEAAAEHGSLALAMLLRGNIDEALKHARRASMIEREYGDDPDWKEFRCLVEEIETNTFAIKGED